MPVERMIQLTTFTVHTWEEDEARLQCFLGVSKRILGGSAV